MSCQPMNEMTDQAKNQLACNLAALILHDENTDVTSENLSKVLKKTGMSVPDFWPLLMAKALEGQNFGDLLKVGGGGSGSGPANNQGGEQAVAEEEKEPTVEEESEDMDMGDLFG